MLAAQQSPADTIRSGDDSPASDTPPSSPATYPAAQEQPDAPEPPTPGPENSATETPDAATDSDARSDTDGHDDVPRSDAPQPADIDSPDTQTSTGGESGSIGRRGRGTLRGAILDILEARPDQAYKISELCRLIDRAHEGTGAKKASAGAVHNAAMKLAGAGTAILVSDKPVTFTLAPPQSSTTDHQR